MHSLTQAHFDGAAQRKGVQGAVWLTVLSTANIPASYLNGAMGAKICQKAVNGRFLPRKMWASHGDDCRLSAEKWGAGNITKDLLLSWCRGRRGLSRSYRPANERVSGFKVQSSSSWQLQTVLKCLLLRLENVSTCVHLTFFSRVGQN
eukprot:1141054-Pelagomonas_calceolata.AAC.2